MGQGILECDAHAQLSGIPLGHHLKEILIFPFAAAQYDYLHASLQQIVEYSLQQIESLLRYQPRHCAKERDFGIDPESERALQAGLARSLAGEVPETVVPGDEPIHLRVPDFVVGAVQYAHQTGCACFEDTLEPEAIFRCLDLPAIRGAHRGERVGKHDRAFHEVDLTIKLEMAGCKQILVQPQQPPLVGRKQPLISEVVDGQYRPHRGKLGIQLRLGLQERDRHGRLPVVRMKNMRRAELAEYFQDAAREERKSFRVVRIVTFQRAIQEGPIEVPVASNEINRNACAERGREQRAHFGSAGDGDMEPNAGIAGNSLLKHVAVGRHNYTDLVAEALQGNRERAHHVRKAARLGKRDELRADHDDL